MTLLVSSCTKVGIVLKILECITFQLHLLMIRMPWRVSPAVFFFWQSELFLFWLNCISGWCRLLFDILFLCVYLPLFLGTRSHHFLPCLFTFLNVTLYQDSNSWLMHSLTSSLLRLGRCTAALEALLSRCLGSLCSLDWLFLVIIRYKTENTTVLIVIAFPLPLIWDESLKELIPDGAVDFHKIFWTIILTFWNTLRLCFVLEHIFVISVCILAGQST